MNRDRSHIEDRIRQAGLKVTPQRYAVLEYLFRTDEHPTAERIESEVNRQWPAASRATIYNALNALKEANLVQEVRTEAATRFEVASAPHHHFVCRVCGVLKDLGPESLTSQFEIETGDGARIEEFTIIARGVCSACLEKHP
jgi:Fur family transcriptional regulator, peroxide stress response regulator